ncbi:MAG: ubiquinone/menaquinone biosynthesis protein [Sphingomonadaceae bacterium]|nr:ubiquinone/menaquinone biosynthesis protein [Sphingomonadaceae bacterium]
MTSTYDMPVAGDEPIWDIFLSQHFFPALSVADEIGLFPALADGPLETDALAAAIEVDARALSIHLGLLAALGLATRREGKWGDTAVSRAYLVPDSPFYWGALINGGEPSQLHRNLLAALRPGTRDWTEGRPVGNWESGQLEIEQARHIAAFMHAHSLPAAIAAARSGVFEGVKSLMDVGAGSGCFAIAAARANPGLRATIMELPAMCEAARPYIEEGEVADRVTAQAVDMFREPWPEGHDALFFSNIWHDWNEETCGELAAKAHAALAPGGRIILHEQLMNDTSTGPLTTASFSMLMLLGTRGKQYSLAELRAILEPAGFSEVGAVHSRGYYSLVTGRKA